MIAAGFQGMSYTRDHNARTRRLGHDQLALAAALGADFCEILFDVEGEFSADPRCINDAQLIDQISFGTLETLAAPRRASCTWTPSHGRDERDSARRTGGSGFGTHIGASAGDGVMAVTSSAQRRFVRHHQVTSDLTGCIIHADEGYLIDSENLHDERPGEPCQTLTIAGEDLLKDTSTASRFIDLLPPGSTWWGDRYGPHARLDPDTDLSALTQAAHDAFVAPETTPK